MLPRGGESEFRSLTRRNTGFVIVLRFIRGHMKNKLLIPIILLSLAGAHLWARQAPTQNAAAPCDDSNAVADKKKEAIDHDPLLDPIVEMRARAQKKLEEKNFKEMQESATELAVVSARMSKEIDTGGQYVISLRVLEDLDKIEKLTKKIRSRAK